MAKPSAFDALVADRGVLAALQDSMRARRRRGSGSTDAYLHSGAERMAEAVALLDEG